MKYDNTNIDLRLKNEPALNIVLELLMEYVDGETPGTFMQIVVGNSVYQLRQVMLLTQDFLNKGETYTEEMGDMAEEYLDEMMLDDVQQLLAPQDTVQG